MFELLVIGLLREPLNRSHVTGVLPERDICNGLYRRTVFPGIAEKRYEAKNQRATVSTDFQVSLKIATV
ncbi:MAG: hypothetical protein IPM89_14945 [Candidatus Competibacteraceae bacterium]|nr:MAG: hypothetical protein IPM89_14945 [Candidatus Competibacteraceae bacterium]